MKSLKLVTDFDGVWTNQLKEAEYVWHLIFKKLTQITKLPESELNRIITDSKADMDRNPYKYGWMNNGKIAAFYQEDPFGDNNALFNYISRAGSLSSFSVLSRSLAKLKNASSRANMNPPNNFQTHVSLKLRKSLKN